MSIIELKDGAKTSYKVTKHVPELYLSDTKFFNNKEDALKQFKEWLE